MGAIPTSCYGRLTVHLHGQMTCTNPECALEPDGHIGTLASCRICFRIHHVPDRWRPVPEPVAS